MTAGRSGVVTCAACSDACHLPPAGEPAWQSPRRIVAGPAFYRRLLAHAETTQRVAGFELAARRRTEPPRDDLTTLILEGDFDAASIERALVARGYDARDEQGILILQAPPVVTRPGFDLTDLFNGARGASAAPAEVVRNDIYGTWMRAAASSTPSGVANCSVRSVRAGSERARMSAMWPLVRQEAGAFRLSTSRIARCRAGR